MHLRKLFCGVLCLTLMFPSGVFASCDCGPVISMFKAEMNSQLSSMNSDRNLFDARILEKLEKIGQALGTSAVDKKASEEAREKMQMEALITALNSALNTHRLAEQAMKYNEDLKIGKTPTEILPGVNCGQSAESERGSGMGVGAGTRAKVEDIVKNNLNRAGVYPRGRDQLSNLRTAIEEKKLHEKLSLKPKNGLTYTEEEFEAAQILMGAAADPVPPLDMSKANMDADEKKEYEAYLELYKAALEPARQAKANYHTSYSPSLPLGSHTRQLYEESKSGYTYPETAAKNGKVSQMELYEANSIWINSPGYKEKIRQENVSRAILESINMTYALNLDILKTLKDISYMLTVRPEALQKIEDKLERVNRKSDSK